GRPSAFEILSAWRGVERGAHAAQVSSLAAGAPAVRWRAGEAGLLRWRRSSTGCRPTRVRLGTRSEDDPGTLFRGRGSTRRETDARVVAVRSAPSPGLSRC